MAFWDSGLVFNGLLICALLFVASTLRRLLPPLQKLGVPDSMVAGFIGLVLGPTALALLPLDTDALESIVYHGLALVFIAVSLQTPVTGKGGGGAKSVAFAIPTFAVLQGLVGLLAVLAFTFFMTERMHPGMGLMVPLGFNQGPGQALSLGKAWEASGFVDGGDVGLIVAAMGFAWAVFIGVPLVWLGRKLGWAQDPGRSPEAVQHQVTARPSKVPGKGGLELLTTQGAWIGLVYLATYGCLLGLDHLLESKPGIQPMIWGFHFIIATFLALGLRRLADRVKPDHMLDDRTLGRISGATVDLITCGALAAVSLTVFRANLVPILVLTTLGGTATLLACLWLARRAFPSAPFEHAVVMFGAATGTLPTGLALLRILDPDMEGPVPGNVVLGSAGALVLSIPLLLVVLPIPIAGYAEDYFGSILLAAGICVVYITLLLVGWRFLGPLRFDGPLGRIWPRPQPEGDSKQG
jgi:ESS family glutamate:Na+ symporter